MLDCVETDAFSHFYSPNNYPITSTIKHSGGIINEELEVTILAYLWWTHCEILHCPTEWEAYFINLKNLVNNGWPFFHDVLCFEIELW